MKTYSFNRYKLVAGGLFAGMALSGCENAQDKGREKKKDFQNVVFIISDDHSYKTLGCYGNEIINTPNIDRLASEGVTFTNGYTSAPICSPSRQSIQTSKYPHASGVTLLFTPFVDDGNVTVAEHFKNHGYATCMIGKTHWNNWIWGSLYKDGPPDHGYDVIIDKNDYRKHLEEHPPEPVPESIMTRQNSKPSEGIAWAKNADALPVGYYEKDSEGTYFSNKAVEFIKENKDRPFFLWVAYHQPHASFYFPVEYAGRYKPEDMPLPQGSPEDDMWVPEIFRDLTEAERRGIIAAYYSCVEYMDHSTGIILDALKEEGLEDNTLIVYASDQGYLLNDHKRFEKHTFWKEAIKAPLIIKGKGKYEAGKRTGAPVEFIDLVPTFADIAGLPQHPDFQGKSFLPLLRGETSEHRDVVFAEYMEDNKAMVATEEWKYIFQNCKRDMGLNYETGETPIGIYHRLYNLRDDPGETTNLAFEPEHQDLIEKFRDIMLQRFMETSPYADECPAELNKTGKLVWFCEPRDVGAEAGGVPLRVFYNERFRSQE